MQVLQTDFGLEAFIMHNDLDEATRRYMSRDSGGRPAPMRTTISNLILPSRLIKREPVPSADLMDMNETSYHVGVSSLVHMDSLRLSEGQKKRFAHAMNVLKLDVFVHPSQLEEEVSANSPGEGFKGGDFPRKIAEDSTPFTSNSVDSRIRRRLKSKQFSHSSKVTWLIPSQRRRSPNGRS